MILGPDGRFPPLANLGCWRFGRPLTAGSLGLPLKSRSITAHSPYRSNPLAYTPCRHTTRTEGGSGSALPLNPSPAYTPKL